jgi:hypothetical protein
MFDNFKSLFATSLPPEFRDPDLGSLMLEIVVPLFADPASSAIHIFN